MTLSVKEARDLFLSGVAITLYDATSRARGWCYATLRRAISGDDIEWKAPGTRAWSIFRSGASRRSVHGLPARLLLRILGGKAGRTLHSRWVLARSVACSVCGETLTHPDSIEHQAGPECRGENARRDQARTARRERISTLTPEAMAARIMARRMGV